VVCPDTFATQDALAQIAQDKGIGLLSAGELWHPVVIQKTDSELCRNVSELTPVTLVAKDARFRMGGQHQLHDHLSVFYHRW
jgi:hypothetical protein